MGVCLGSIIAQVTIIGPVSFYLIRKLFNDMTDGSIGRESQPASPVLSVE
jgi:hypothetical protein